MSAYKEDIELQCADAGCGTFTFTAGEQSFYDDKGFTPPKRCKKHRELARIKREEAKAGQQTSGYKVGNQGRDIL